MSFISSEQMTEHCFRFTYASGIILLKDPFPVVKLKRASGCNSSNNTSSNVSVSACTMAKWHIIKKTRYAKDVASWRGEAISLSNGQGKLILLIIQ